MAKTLDTLVTETLGAQLRMILELQARCEAAEEKAAAIPDMLAALKAVIADVDVEQGADVSDGVIAKVRAAVAKAEGGK